MTATPYKNWQWYIDAERILWLSLDRHDSAVNALNTEVLSEFDALLDAVDQDSVIGIVIRSAKTSGFIAGADVEEFVQLTDQTIAFESVRRVQLIFDKLVTLKIPTVAMIHGFCLGGGLELALACQYRVAQDGANTRLGAPEVNLGLHPGWGGTVRLPRLIGLLPAMRLNLTGRAVSAKAAVKLGLVDAVVPQRHLERAARSYVIHKPKLHQPVWWQRMPNNKWLRPWVAKVLYQNLAKKINREHYPAPYAMVDNWLYTGVAGNEPIVREARSIAALLLSDTSRHLVRAFLLQMRLKGLAKSTGFTPKRVHVLGAGVMGGDIAAWCALKGLEVTLQDQSLELIAPAIQRAHALFQKKLSSPRLAQAALDRLIPDVVGAGIARADVVIEAVSEDLRVKQAIYQAIEPRLKLDAILATNTSSLSLYELSALLQDPSRLVGMHFFNPVAKMQLVEVVQSDKTASSCLNQALVFVHCIDRLPLPVKNCPGFLVNRILMPYLMEAMILLDEGKLPESIDQAALAFGMLMGPMELADRVGLDVCLAVAETLTKQQSAFSVSKTLQQKVSAGELGHKSAKGFYRYEQNKPLKAEPKPGFESLIDRLILPLLNEAVACVREKIVLDEELLDAGLVFGAGFAPFRGGPLHYIRNEGIPPMVIKLTALHQQYGERFKPDAGWATL